MATLPAPAITARFADKSSAEFWQGIELAGLSITIVLAFALQSIITLVGGVAICLAFVVRHAHLLPVSSRTVTNCLMVLLLFFPAFLKPGHGFSPVFYFFATAVTFVTAYTMSRFSAAALHLAATILYFVLAALVGIVLYIYWGSPTPFAEVIEGSSTNGIPAYMIIVQTFLCVTTFVMHGRAPLVTPIITFLIAFYGSGRGSLVVGSLLVMGGLAFNLFPRKVPFIYRLLLMAISIAAMAQLAIYAVELFDYVSRYTKLSVGISDRNREAIIASYLSKIDVFTFFIGADYSGTLIEFKHEGNPHIAYIRTHSFFGIFPTLMAALSPLIIFFARGPWSLKLPIGFYVGMAAVRAATEPVLFPTLLDVFFFLMILMFFRARDAAESSRPRKGIA
ncbi:hypothetical protein [Parerythrobacter jejuensis]|uniref:Uncharacterized protein n=1 Tax=Parerythrobacter jejuensis TaxID=795812 RepID=A0A845ARY4_9SPHN|nr:hypothetical protein [Parerythrobacter jejuensis]MXP30882.1 hypothetical protein [Parerythrobacter jejuensis]MXP33642.1 hypothetical protein [Parerythrobacter jejuensis]